MKMAGLELGMVLMQHGFALMVRFETWYVAGGDASRAAAPGGAMRFESPAGPSSAERTRIAALLMIAVSVIFAISQSSTTVAFRFEF